MINKKRGRKIKHTRSLYKRKKSASRIALSWVILFVVLGGTGFLGYSIAPPVIDFFKNFGNDDKSSEDVWTPPEVSSSIIDSSSASDSKNDTIIAENIKTYELPVQALLNEQALKTALNTAKSQGFTNVSAPLKIAGGELYFKTTNPTAVTSKAVKGALTAADIARIIKESGLVPVAKMSILNDNLAPRADYLIGYKFEKEESMWLDDYPEKGGKPWISPFSQQAKTYITQLVNEVSAAGFSTIIASDLIFPEFSANDLGYIGAIVKDTNRYKALTSMAQLIKTEADKSKINTQIQISALEAIVGKSEVLVPAELNGIALSFRIDLKSATGKIKTKAGAEIDFTSMSAYDRTKAMIEQCSLVSGNTKFIPSLSITGLSEDDINQAKKAFDDLGYKSYTFVQ